MNNSLQKALLFVIALGISIIAVELVPVSRKARLFNLCMEREALDRSLISYNWQLRNPQKALLSKGEKEYFEKRRDQQIKKINVVLPKLAKEWELDYAPNSPEPMLAMCNYIRNSSYPSNK